MVAASHLHLDTQRTFYANFCCKFKLKCYNGAVKPEAVFV